MLRVLEGQSAFDPSRAVPRATLREEARRCVGDTGLLDHLLRHMPRAGELAQVRKLARASQCRRPCIVYVVFASVHYLLQDVKESRHVELQ